MSGNEIAALIIAFTGMLGAVFAGFRNLRGDAIKREVEAAAAVLTGYTTLAGALQAELSRMKDEHSKDRQAWFEERAAMRRDHAADLARLRAEHKVEIDACTERINELGAKIYALQHRAPETRNREGD